MSKKIKQSKDKPVSETVIDQDDKFSVKATYNKEEKLAVASTDIVDRHGERINQEGWDLKNFKKNPVMLWAHDHNEIAVGNARNIHIERAGGSPRLVFTPDFHDKTETARSLKALFEEGWLNSFSVGFIPKDFDGQESTYLKQELLEISAVNVPANAEATMLAYKSLVDKGFKKEVIEEVTGVVAEDLEEAEEAEGSEEEVSKDKKQTVSEKLKGALADEIEANEIMEQKFKNMRKFHDISWAFMDVYYDEETDVNDFEKLLGEYVVEINKLKNGSDEKDAKKTESTEADKEKEDISGKVLDSLLSVSEDINKLDEKVDTLAKTLAEKTTVAPKSPKARAIKSLSKVIAKTSDDLLQKEKTNANQDTVKQLRVIKRAAEILNKENKTQ